MRDSKTVSSLCECMLQRGLDWKDRLTDYEVDISAIHLATYYEMVQLTSVVGNGALSTATNDKKATTSLIMQLIDHINQNVYLMHNSSDFTTYAIPTCQSALRALTLIVTANPSLLEDPSLYRTLLQSCYNIYHETLNVVADSEIFTGDDNTDDPSLSLLSKGPIQPSLEEGDSDSIAKNKLDCRGHIIGESDPQQTERLKRLMLSSWLTCKHSVLFLSTLLTLLDKKCVEQCSEDIPHTIETARSYLRGDTVEESRFLLTTDDILFLVWDLLCSILTIKHIGGIVFVADAITSILKHVTSLGQENPILAGYDFYSPLILVFPPIFCLYCLMRITLITATLFYVVLLDTVKHLAVLMCL